MRRVCTVEVTGIGHAVILPFEHGYVRLRSAASSGDLTMHGRLANFTTIRAEIDKKTGTCLLNGPLKHGDTTGVASINSRSMIMLRIRNFIANLCGGPAVADQVNPAANVPPQQAVAAAVAAPAAPAVVPASPVAAAEAPAELLARPPLVRNDGAARVRIGVYVDNAGAAPFAAGGIPPAQ
jgi:hypothetical protein